jgi:hypothetical protein
MWRKLADVAFWIGLALYFGGILVIGVIVAPGVFDAARENHLTMQGITVPPLEMWKEVGGEVFGNVLNRFRVVESVSLALMLAGIAGWMLGHKHVRRSTWVLAALWTLVAVLTVVDLVWLQNRIWDLRTVVRQEAPAHAGEGMEARWPARDQFESLHNLDESLNKGKGYVLLGMILVASWRGLADKKAGYTPDAPEIVRKTISKHPG